MDLHEHAWSHKVWYVFLVECLQLHHFLPIIQLVFARSGLLSSIRFLLHIDCINGARGDIPAPPIPHDIPCASVVGSVGLGDLGEQPQKSVLVSELRLCQLRLPKQRNDAADRVYPERVPALVLHQAQQVLHHDANKDLEESDSGSQK